VYACRKRFGQLTDDNTNLFQFGQDTCWIKRLIYQLKKYNLQKAWDFKGLGQEKFIESFCCLKSNGRGWTFQTGFDRRSFQAG